MEIETLSLNFETFLPLRYNPNIVKIGSIWKFEDGYNKSYFLITEVTKNGNCCLGFCLHSKKLISNKRMNFNFNRENWCCIADL